MVRLVILLFLARLAFFALIFLVLPNARWNNWDAPHFLYIAQHGYTSTGDEANFIVFPPLYPAAIRLFAATFGSFGTWAIVISNISFVVANVIFFKLLSEKYSQKVAAIAIFLLNIFPTAYFFSSPYTESLFLALSVGSLYASHKKHWLLAGALAGLAFSTRMPGIFLLPTLCWQATRDRNFLNLLKVTVPVLVCVGLYLLINQAVYGNPLAFADILHKHWYKTLVPPWESIATSLRVAQAGWLSTEHSRMVGMAEAIAATLALIFIPIVARTVKDFSYTILYSSTVIFITSTSFLLSTPRYLAVIPPLFIAFAIIGARSRIFLCGVSFIFALLMTYFGLIFAKGMWAF